MQEQKTKQTNLDWLEQEVLQTAQQSNFPQLPAIRFEENKITEITIDFSEKFPEWNTTGLTGKPTTKAIIPIEYEGIKKVWWLNKLNPIYREIINAGKQGITKFKILQTGTQQNTRYVIIK